ncbi:MAG: sulfite exporter TauE/SafE family protein [Nitrospira sp.]|nr:sulfite exporter TauE/SafE family protein [Nitrospira sp.]
MTAPAMQSGSNTPPNPLIHAFLFVFGFSIIFITLGTAVSGIGQLVFDLREPLARLGGVIVIVFGLATMGLFDVFSRWLDRLENSDNAGVRHFWIPVIGWMKNGVDFFRSSFYRDTRTELNGPSRSGYLPSFLMGIFFSAGWTPCIGPTLSAILALGYNATTIGQGAFLLAAYSLGLGIPFLLFALALDRASSLLRLLKRHIRTIQLINGTMLILIGFALMTKQLATIARWAQENNFYVEAGFLGGGTPTFFIAALAGLLSFLSPCVLPLVPAYIFYLTGHTFSKITTH